MKDFRLKIIRVSAKRMLEIKKLLPTTDRVAVREFSERGEIAYFINTKRKNMSPWKKIKGEHYLCPNAIALLKKKPLGHDT